MKLWFISMECAGIAEAGGVKNVTFSLCKEFAQLKHSSTLFIPVFKCSEWNLLKDVNPVEKSVSVHMCGKMEEVHFSTAVCTAGNFNVVLVHHPSFEEKEAVYTYTENEQKINPENRKGEGHKDTLFMDVLFQKAVCAYGELISKSSLPDIIHCQDASTASLPAFARKSKLFPKTKFVVTIHNAGPSYHHSFSSLGEAAWYTRLDTDLLTMSLNGNAVEPFLLALNSGAEITTVSEAYADELIDPENSEMTDGLSRIFAQRNVKITGITNGFDFDRYNPQDIEISKMPYAFNPEKNQLEGKYLSREFFINEIIDSKNDISGIKKFGTLDCSEKGIEETFIAYHGRVTTQKGITVLTQVIPTLIENFDKVRFIVAGQGEPRLEGELEELTRKYPGKIVFLNGYNQKVVRLATAVSDFIVLPSYFEPCGLEDFIAQSYGTLPVAHKTGGLNKIIDGKTGFLYERNTPEALLVKLVEVIMIKKLQKNEINRMIKNAAVHVHKEYYWKTVIQRKYIPFFKEILKNN